MSHRAIAEACGISAASVTRILQGGIQRKRDRPQRVGRPRKLTARQQRLLLRNLLISREDNPGFTLKDLMDQSGVSRGDVSEHTVSRFLKRNGYFYLQARKKRLLTKNDLVQRVRFAKRMQAGYDRDRVRQSKWASIWMGCHLLTNQIHCKLPRRPNPESGENLPKGCRLVARRKVRKRELAGNCSLLFHMMKVSFYVSHMNT